MAICYGSDRINNAGRRRSFYCQLLREEPWRFGTDDSPPLSSTKDTVICSDVANITLGLQDYYKIVPSPINPTTTNNTLGSLHLGLSIQTEAMCKQPLFKGSANLWGRWCPKQYHRILQRPRCFRSEQHRQDCLHLKPAREKEFFSESWDPQSVWSLKYVACRGNSAADMVGNLSSENFRVF